MYDNEFIVLRDEKFVYCFNNAVSMYQGNYCLNLTIKFEYCDFFNCKWETTHVPKNVSIYDYDHNKVGIASIFIEYNRVIPYIEDEEKTTYPADNRYGYKLLCESISSHIKTYYLCRVVYPDDATKIYTIDGTIRSNKFTVDNIISLVEINSYEYDEESLHIIHIEEVNAVNHSPFIGPYNSVITYVKGDTLTVDEIEMNSYKSLGKGLYVFSNVDDAISYLNRVVYKGNNVMNMKDGRTVLLSDFIGSLIPLDF
jgi:hypothetical protein